MSSSRVVVCLAALAACTPSLRDTPCNSDEECTRLPVCRDGLAPTTNLKTSPANVRCVRHE